MQLVELLLGRGASIDLQDKDGFTALMCAAVGGNPSIVSVLLRAGARTDLHDINGQTALDVADRLPMSPPSQKDGDRDAPRLPGCSASTPPHRQPRKQPPPRRALPRKALRLEARQVGSAWQAAVVKAPVTRIGGMVARAQRRQA